MISREPPSMDEWRALLANAAYPSVYQTPEMNSVYRATPTYKPIIAVSRDKSGGLEALLSGATIRLGTDFPFRLVVYSTPRGGPLVRKDAGERVTIPIMNMYARAAKSSGAIYTRMYRSPGQTPITLPAEGNRWTFENAFDFVIDLNITIDELLAKLDKGRRKNIRATEKTGAAVRIANDTAGFETLTEQYATVAAEAGLLPYPPQFLEAAFKNLVQGGMASIFVCEINGAPVASRCLLHHGGRAIDWIAGASLEAAETHANEFLVWEMIRWCKEHGLKAFDFGGAGTGSNIPGITEFKRRFGGEMVNPGRYLTVHRKVRWWLFERIAARRRRLG